MKLRSLHRTGVLIALLLLIVAAGQSRAELPPEAQESIKKGMLAAKEQEWLIAIQSFQEARKTAPDAPEIFYNLGLAESKLPGRELRAIAWFGAYLAANPTALNATAVNDFIAGLQIKNEGNLNRLIKTVQDAATQAAQNRENALATVAELWAQSGDMTAALQTIDFIPHSDGKIAALAGVAEVQASAGDRVGAQRTLMSARITADRTLNADWHFADGRSEAYKKIAEAQARAGDIPGGEATAEQIQEAFFKCAAQIAIAEVQIKASDLAGANRTLVAAERTSDLIGSSMSIEYKVRIASAKIQAGDAAGARQTLLSARKLAESEPSASSTEASLKCTVQTRIFKLQAEAGDLEGARQSLAGALKTLELVTDKSGSSYSLHESQLKRGFGTIRDIVDKRLEVGDIAGAQQYADLIQDADTRGYVQKSIVEAQARAGDIEGAQRTADLIRNAEQKADAQRAIADAKAKSGSTSSPAITVSPTIAGHASVQPVVPAIDVSGWIRKLDDKSTYDECPLNTDPFLDLAGYLKSRPSSDDPGKVFDALRTTAEKLIKAQNIIDQMLKQQAKQSAKV